MTQFKIVFLKRWQTEGPAKTLGTLALVITKVSGNALIRAEKRAFNFRQPSHPGLSPRPNQDPPALPPAKGQNPTLSGTEDALSRFTEWSQVSTRSRGPEGDTWKRGRCPRFAPPSEVPTQHAPFMGWRKSSVRAVRSAIRIASDPELQTTRLRSSRRLSPRIVCDSRVAKRRLRTWILKINDPLKPGRKRWVKPN